MEVKFNETTLSCIRPVLCAVQDVEQTLELRLPDGYPDIGRILGCWGQILIRGKEWRSSAMSASAGIMAWVMYAPEDGSIPKVVDAWIPFQCKWDFPEPMDDGVITLKPQLTELDSRSTSARKIMVRACVDMMGQAMVHQKIQISKGDELPDDVQLRVENYPVELPVEGGEKQIQLELPLNLPGNFHKAVSMELVPQVQEEKIVANRLVFKGDAAVRMAYLCEDGTLLTWQNQFPFSQFVELDRDYDAGASVWTMPVVTALETGEGENGQMQLKVGIAAQYLIFERTVLEIPSDAYSTEREMTLKIEDLTIPVRLDCRTVEVNVEGKTENSGHIVDITPMATFPKWDMEDDEMQIRLEGKYQILSRDELDQLRGITASFSGKVAFRSARENRLELWLGTANVPNVMPSVELSTVQCTFPVTAMVYAGQPIPMIVGMELGEKKQPDPERPSLILRRAGEEDLWTLAKKCGSTVEAIRQANHLQQEPENGQMLLIPVC